MSDFATEIGIIDANGQIPGVRVQGELTLSCRQQHSLTVSIVSWLWDVPLPQQTI